MTIINAPTGVDYRKIADECVFLGGSTGGGNAVNWQREAATFFDDLGYTVFNPRRDDWDARITESLDCPEFVEQLEWEYNQQAYADYIIYNFVPNTNAPITMLELGMFGAINKTIFVICPSSFYKHGNISYICKKLGIRCFNSMKELFHYFLAMVD